MNANQVVIVDREDFKYALRCARRGDDMRLTGKYLDRLLAALDRDSDELEARLAKAIGEAIWKHDNSEKRDFKAFLARAVLHALQEGTEK